MKRYPNTSHTILNMLSSDFIRVDNTMKGEIPEARYHELVADPDNLKEIADPDRRGYIKLRNWMRYKKKMMDKMRK